MGLGSLFGWVVLMDFGFVYGLALDILGVGWVGVACGGFTSTWWVLVVCGFGLVRVYFWAFF